MLTQIDTKIIKILNNKPDDFWDFKDNYEKEHIHSIITYPATMVPKMQSELIDIIIKEKHDVHNLLDPFMGSGTILTLGTEKTLNINGIDINPLSYLICNVKTKPLSITSLKSKSEYLFLHLNDEINYSIYFKGIVKWFKPYVIHELTKIRHCILKEKNEIYRKFFFVAFAETIRKVWNSRSSTYKLHKKPDKIIEEFDVEPINIFKNQVEYNISMMDLYKSLLKNYNFKKKLYCNDSYKILKDKRRFKENSIDLIVTSPPYGDNHTTVPYGQNSVLQLRWIGIDNIDRDIDTSLINTLNGIDSKSLGGLNYKIEYINNSNILKRSKTLFNLFNVLIKDNKIDKAKKVASFMIDFEKVLIEMYRVLKYNHYAVFTTGNRIVNGECVELDKILIELSLNLNMELIYDFKRNILHKRSPSKVSETKDNNIVKSINQETVIILKKL